MIYIVIFARWYLGYTLFQFMMRFLSGPNPRWLEGPWSWIYCLFDFIATPLELCFDIRIERTISKIWWD